MENDHKSGGNLETDINHVQELKNSPAVDANIQEENALNCEIDCNCVFKSNDKNLADKLYASRWSKKVKETRKVACKKKGKNKFDLNKEWGLSG